MCVGRYLENELSDIPRHPHPRLPGGRLKSRKYKKSAVGGKKSPANAGTKRDYLIFYRQVSNRWNNTISCFFTANGGLFYGHRPLFDPCRLLSSCEAWRGGGGDDKKGNSFSDWRHRQPQKGEADNRRHDFFLTSSSCHPKIFVKEFSYFLMSCHQHCLGVNLLVQR